MQTPHSYDTAKQLLNIECALQITAVRLLLCGEYYGTYEAEKYRSVMLDRTQVIAIPVPQSLTRKTGLEMELNGNDASIREQVIMDNSLELKVQAPQTEPTKNSSDQILATINASETRQQLLNQWLIGEPAENMDLWVERYTNAANWQALATQDFESFVQALFLIVLQRKASSDTLEFYVEKFGAQTDAAGAIQRITRSDESKAIHAHQQQLNPATGALVQQLIAAPTNG